MYLIAAIFLTSIFNLCLSSECVIIDNINEPSITVDENGLIMGDDYQSIIGEDIIDSFDEDKYIIYRNFLEELNSYPIYENLNENEIVKLPPLLLVSGWRFDVMAKYIYAKYKEKNIKSNWGTDIYIEHLKVWNNLSENYPLKSGAQDYIKTFDAILHWIKNEGCSKSIVPIDKRKLICNGSHRVAACLLYNKEVKCRYNSLWRAPCATASLFAKEQSYVKGGLQRKYLDNMALEYCMLKPNTYIACCFPAAESRHKEVEKTLASDGIIIYKKNIKFSANGSLNLIKLLYENQPWLGNIHNNFAGAQYARKVRFPQLSGTLTVYLFECRSLEAVISCKAKIRQLCNVGNPAIHINDNHAETISLAQTFFNNNSIHFLNYAKSKSFTNFFSYLKHYKTWLLQKKLDPEYFCVDSSAVMAAYGIRDCADLDFLHHGFEGATKHTDNVKVSSHNSSLGHHTIGLDEIIFNPDNYFYYKGLKFASIEVIKNMKQKRNEPKDIRDINLIHAAFR